MHIRICNICLCIYFHIFYVVDVNLRMCKSIFTNEACQYTVLHQLQRACASKRVLAY